MSDSRERQTSELLALLDGELTEPIAIDALLARPGARAELAELTRIRRSLSGIPDIIPDAAVWERIQERAGSLQAVDLRGPRKERTGGGLAPPITGFRSPRHPGLARSRAPFAMAAGLLLAVSVALLTVNVVRQQDATPGADLPVADNAMVLETLHARSRQLEPLVQSSRKGLADSSERALMVGIADLDSQLSLDPSNGSRNPGEEQYLWSRRVALLESLAEVRRARAVLQPAVY